MCAGQVTAIRSETSGCAYYMINLDEPKENNLRGLWRRSMTQAVQ